MIKRESNKVAIFLLLSMACFAGLPLYVTMHGLEEDDDSLLTLVTMPALLLGFFGFWILATVFLARAKGYPAVLGLLGIFWLLGTLVLVVLPDKAKGDGPPTSN